MRKIRLLFEILIAVYDKKLKEGVMAAALAFSGFLATITTHQQLLQINYY